MLGSTLNLLNLIGKFGLHNLILVGLEHFQGLVFLESGNESSQLINECSCAMFDQVIDGDEHIEVLASLFEIVLEHPDPLNGNIYNFLE